MKSKRLVPALASLVTCVVLLPGPLKAAEEPSSPPAFTAKPPWSDASFFPIAVWLQSPANAERFRKAGINLYIGLWKGPTEEQLSMLGRGGMKLICDQNEVGLRHRDDTNILAWMHGDEPDNAQALPSGKGYGPPIPPSRIVEDYRRIHAADPSRPVLLNLGQGVAWDRYFGRGVRTNHPEDYPEYMEGCDIVSFDIYPAVHDRPEIAGKLWYVAQGVERLVKWSGGRKTVWNCLECTRISNVERKPTPREVRCEAWMSLIHGSRGLIYFVHQFKPVFREAALLDDPEMLEAVTRLNTQVTSLAPVLNRPSVPGVLEPISDNPDVPVAATVKRTADATYVFSVAMRDGEAGVRFGLSGLRAGQSVEVLGEGRSLEARAGEFADRFKSWDVHLYRIPAIRN